MTETTGPSAAFGANIDTAAPCGGEAVAWLWEERLPGSRYKEMAKRVTASPETVVNLREAGIKVHELFLHPHSDRGRETVGAVPSVPSRDDALRVGRAILEAHGQWEKENIHRGSQPLWGEQHVILLGQTAILSALTGAGK